MEAQERSLWLCYRGRCSEFLRSLMHSFFPY